MPVEELADHDAYNSMVMLRKLNEIIRYLGEKKV
jgi:hypothetical protein